MSIANTQSDAALHLPVARSRGWMSHLSQLTKARLSGLVLLTTIVGFVAGNAQAGMLKLLFTTIGTALAACAASALNQAVEVRRDALMHRTRHRPLVVGAIRLQSGYALGVLMGLAGIGILTLGANLLAAGLALLTILLYVCLYTPMKARTSLNTLVGAVVGAIPPMIGWAAATGSLNEGACVLGAILFFWQIPHFLSLAWMYREDYERGRFVMLPVIDRSGDLTCRIVLLTSFLMLPITLAAVLAGVAGWWFAVGSCALALVLIVPAIRMVNDLNRNTARAVFLASIMYLPLLMALLIADRGPIQSMVHPALAVARAIN